MTNKIQLPVQKINQPYTRVNEPYATLTPALREMFGVQLYKNNARATFAYFEYPEFRLAAACA